MQKSKVKSRNARIKIEDAGISLLCPVAVCEAENSKSWKLALLPFAFCLLTFAFALCLSPTALHAQGCAMCYTSASAARSTAKEALANGTLILLIPPMVFFALITVIVYRYRNKYRETANWPLEHDRELQKMLADLVPAKGIQQIRKSEDRVIC